MEFNNRPNFKVKDEATGQEHWVSRSVAVVAIPLFRFCSCYWVPMGLRSDLVLESGKWGLPCGFLDYDESAQDAVRREIWEELGLELGEKDVNTQPNAVISKPVNEEAQTVSLRFIIHKSVKELPPLRPGKEVLSAVWLPVCLISSLEQKQPIPIKGMDMAYNHPEIIKWSLS